MHKQMVNGMASSCRAEAADDQRETGHTHTHTHTQSFSNKSVFNPKRLCRRAMWR